MSSIAVLALSIILFVILSVRQGSASVFFFTLKKRTTGLMVMPWWRMTKYTMRV